MRPVSPAVDPLRLRVRGARQDADQAALRGLVENLTPSFRRRTYELIRLATALEHGPSNEHHEAAEALWRTIASRDDGANAVRRAERLMRSYFEDLTRFLAPPPSPEGQQPDPRPGHYYVSAVDADRFWLVSGPYARHADALDAVSEVRARAEKRDSRAYFFAWGSVLMGKSLVFCT